MVKEQKIKIYGIYENRHRLHKYFKVIKTGNLHNIYLLGI